MLNKELCQRCKREYEPHYEVGAEWTGGDDVLWTQGLVECPELGKRVNGNDAITDIRRCAPESCPYAAEHVMREQSVGEAVPEDDVKAATTAVFDELWNVGDGILRGEDIERLIQEQAEDL